MRIEILNVIGRDFIILFPITRGKWFEFGTLESILMDGGNLSLKAFFALERDVELSKEVDEEV